MIEQTKIKFNIVKICWLSIENEAFCHFVAIILKWDKVRYADKNTFIIQLKKLICVNPTNNRKHEISWINVEVN